MRMTVGLIRGREKEGETAKKVAKEEEVREREFRTDTRGRKQDGTHFVCTNLGFGVLKDI
jgi:hypothetical protein